jgi:AraC-like DNA-binding protein
VTLSLKMRDVLSFVRTGARDRDEAVALCGERFTVPDGVGMPGEPDCFAVIHDLWCIGPLIVARVGSGFDGWVKCGGGRATYDIKLTQVGQFESVHSGSAVVAGHGAATILLPERDAALRWGEGAQTVCVNIDRSAVDDALSDALGREVLSQIEFDTAATKTNEVGYWANLLMVLIEQLFHSASLLSHPLVTMPIVDSLVRGLLLAVDHPYRAALTAQAAAPPAPRVVRAAIDIIEAEPALPWTVTSLAARSYTSVRTLQAGFRRHAGVSPMAYLRQVRLRRAHQDLVLADPSTETVAAVAFRWGFKNLSRFAALHKARYRESPAYTLRRSVRGN